MEWDWNLVEDVFPDVLDGLKFTIGATVLGSLIAIVIGLLFAMLRRSRLTIISGTTRWVVEFIRSTPLLVQLLFVYYGGLNTLKLNYPELDLGLFSLTAPFWVGSIVLGVHYGTYMSEVYRAGIDGVPKAQWEGTIALSLPRRQTWTHVILPQAIPKVLPSLGNYVVSMFKETPLLFAIGVAEMLSEANAFSSQKASYVEAVTVVGFLFLVVSLPAALLVRLMERRYERAA